MSAERNVVFLPAHMIAWLKAMAAQGFRVTITDRDGKSHPVRWT